jgi:hypothetical protein
MEVAMGMMRQDAGGTGVSRATFLQMGAAGAVTVVGLTAGGRAVRALSAMTAAGRPAPLSRSAFAPHVGSAFRVRPAGLGAPAVPVRLTDLSDIGGTRGHDQAFSLLFTAGRGSTPIASGVHAFDHPRMGRFQLAIEPVGRGAHVRDYEAIVNRLPGSPGRPRS